MSKFVRNPEKPYGSDVKGVFGGIHVDLPAGEKKEYSDPAAAELKTRYPWLSVSEIEDAVSVQETSVVEAIEVAEEVADTIVEGEAETSAEETEVEKPRRGRPKKLVE